MSQLAEAIAEARVRISRYAKSLNEQATKATLVQPVLRALGWDVENLEDVQLEFRRRPSDKPVDYALLLIRTPCLFVEAKALGQNLDDPKWANQFMGYATVAGVEWVALTNGDEWRLYNSHATVPVEEKLFRSVRIADESAAAEDTLSLLSKERMRENEINILWKAHFVDRQVQAAVEDLFRTNPGPDPSLVRLVSKRVKQLSRSDVRASLHRARLTFDFPVDATLPLVGEKRRRVAHAAVATKKGRATSKERKKLYVGVSLKDLIDAGLLKAPLKLTKKYRGRQFEAEILTDGSVRFQNQIYSSPSTAADRARFTVVGGTPHTNGWDWWQYKEGGTGRVLSLDVARQQYLKRRAK